MFILINLQVHIYSTTLYWDCNYVSLTDHLSCPAGSRPGTLFHTDLGPLHETPVLQFDNNLCVHTIIEVRSIHEREKYKLLYTHHINKFIVSLYNYHKHL